MPRHLIPSSLLFFLMPWWLPVKPSGLKAPALSSQTLCSQATAVRLVSHSAGCEEAGPISDRKKETSQLTDRTGENGTSLGQQHCYPMSYYPQEARCRTTLRVRDVSTELNQEHQESLGIMYSQRLKNPLQH